MNVLKSHFEANGLHYGHHPAHADKSMEIMFESQSNSIASAPLLHSYPPMASVPPHVPFFVLIPEQEREKRRQERCRFLASRRTPRLSKAYINKQCLRTKQSSQQPLVPPPAQGRTVAGTVTGGGAQQRQTVPINDDEEDEDNGYNEDEFEDTGAANEGAPSPVDNGDDDGDAYEDEDFEPAAPVPAPRAPLPVVLPSTHQERGRSLTRDRRVSPLHSRSLSLSRSQSASRSRSRSGSRSRSATRRCQQRLLFLLALVEKGHAVPAEDIEAAIRACEEVDRDALCYPPPPPRPTIPKLSGRYVTAKCIKPRHTEPPAVSPAKAPRTTTATAPAAGADDAAHDDRDDDAADPPLSPAVHRAALASLAAGSGGSASPHQRAPAAQQQLLLERQLQVQRQLRRQQQALHSQLLAQPRHPRARSVSSSRSLPEPVTRVSTVNDAQTSRTRQQRYAEAQRQEHWATAASTPSASAAVPMSPLRLSRTPPPSSSWSSWSSPHRPRASVTSSIHSVASSSAATVAIPSDRLMLRNPAIAAAFLRESNAWRSRHVGKVPSPRDVAVAHRSPMRSPQPALSPIGFRTTTTTTPRSAAKASAVVFDSAELSQLYD